LGGGFSDQRTARVSLIVWQILDFSNARSCLRCLKPPMARAKDMISHLHLHNTQVSHEVPGMKYTLDGKRKDDISAIRHIERMDGT
jgi:hypothetical protein